MSEPYLQKTRPSSLLGSDFPEAVFRAVREILLQKRGLDIALYKERYMRRRLASRVRARGVHDAETYLQILRHEEDEADALLAALTIHVSQFFRNTSAFQVLEERVLPLLMDALRRAGRDQLRIWSVGCAAGEEPYSLALLLAQQRSWPLPVSILATDISPAILQRARQGLFDSGRLAELPAAVRESAFIREAGAWRLRSEIRQSVRFRQHNILHPAPYPAADLVLCRNVLIYFPRQEQERVFQRFAACIPSGGYLVLGKAETLVGEGGRQFAMESPAERIYRRL